MAYYFETQEAANFQTIRTDGTKVNLKGINPTEADANVICEGVSSLLAIGKVSATYENAIRTVKEDVNYED